MPEVEPKKPKVEKVKGRIQTLKVTRYKGCPVYLCRIDEDIFEYLVVFQDNIYRDYLIITPDKGRKTLTKKQVLGAAGLIFTGATTTVDELLKLVQKDLLSNSVESDKIKKAVN